MEDKKEELTSKKPNYSTIAFNARLLGIKTNEKFEFVYEDNQIIAVKFTDYDSSHSIAIGTDVLTFLGKNKFKSIYKVHSIRTDSSTLEDVDFYVSTEPLNQSHKYILPVLLGNHEQYQVDSRLLNTYVSKDFEYLYLKYRFSDAESFLELDKYLRHNKSFVKVVNDNYYEIVYVMKIPKKRLEDIVLILEGRYSHISEEYKKIIKRFYSKSPTGVLLEHVLGNSEELRSSLEDQIGASIPKEIDLDNKPNLQLELWPEDV